jgi:transposase-like protein
MRKVHRHTEAEIASLLDQAQEMAVQGKSHGDIAKALGISLMTYHRWRKARAASRPAPPPVEADRTDAPTTTRDQVRRISELQLENSRLRRLVADLLLEKMKLEETLQRGGANHRMVEQG